MAESRAEYFKNYNKKSPVLSVRIKDPVLYTTIKNIVNNSDRKQNEILNELLDKGVNGSNVVNNSCIQQSKNDILFLMNFFQRNKYLIQDEITSEERIIFKEIAGRLTE